MSHQLRSSIPSESNPKLSTIRHLRQLSNLLDRAIRIPGTSIGIGLDPILGLIPGGGDLAGGLLSAYIVYRAFQLGVPREKLVQMVSNIALETIVGTVPIVGDMFDVAWKANVRNVEILEEFAEIPAVTKKADQGFVFLLLGGLIVLILVVALLTIGLIGLIIQIFNHLF